MRVGAKGAVRYPKPSSSTPAVQTGDPFCIHAQYVFMKNRLLFNECPQVCVCVCSIWPAGFRELNSEGCTAPTHNLHENLIGITRSHTLIHPKPTHTFIHCFCIRVGCQPHPQVNNLSLKLIWISYQSKNRQLNPVKVKSTGDQHYTHTVKSTRAVHSEQYKPYQWSTSAMSLSRICLHSRRADLCVCMWCVFVQCAGVCALLAASEHQKSSLKWG